MTHTAESAPGIALARSLAQRITRGTPQPALTAEIAACPCPPLARAGLHLFNGDWELAHKLAQDSPTGDGKHWHALVHRHEPDFENSKYWLRQAGPRPLYALLARKAKTLGVERQVAPDGRWDPYRFTDAFADPAQPEWTRQLDAYEQSLLLEQQLDPSDPEKGHGGDRG
ncbi:MAG: hypothetical protein OEW39_04405 [Deltaproteobacteria bacterium]|nr:hypothetical protein [Deltaproteobacteria bacterium]